MRRFTFFLLSSLLTLSVKAQTDFNAENLREYIEFRHTKNRYSGITQIYHKDQLIFESVKGLANRSWQIPNRADTKFGLASVTKIFTAVAIGQLMDLGKIEANAPLLTYFPDFPNEHIARNTTIAQLLSHQSGLSDFFFDPVYLEADRSRLRQLADYDRFFPVLKKSSASPAPFAYSNSNFVILGRVIEKVSGRDFYEYLNTEIFDKLGMHNTGFYESDRVISNLAEGYFSDGQAALEFGVPNDGEIRRNSLLRPIKGMPAGGAYSTAFDLYLFMAALNKGGLLTPDLFKKMTTASQSGYGWGFQAYSQNDMTIWGHSGGFYGVSTMVFHLPESHYTFICLTNTDFAAQPIFDRFINLLSGRKPYMPIDIAPGSLKAFEGNFQVVEGEMEGRQIKIEARTDHLLFDKALQFFPMGNDQFFDIDNDQFSLQYLRDEQGAITGFYRSDSLRYKQSARKIGLEEVRVLTAIELTKTQLEEYLGNYEFGNEGMMPGHKPVFSINEGGLMVDNMMRFLPYEKDKFFMEDDIGMRLEFKRNDAGQITGLLVLREKEVVGKVTRLK